MRVRYSRSRSLACTLLYMAQTDTVELRQTAVLRAGLYPRKSKDQRTGKASASVGEQEQVGRADAAAQGWAVVDVYPDDGRSASRFTRKTRDEWVRLREDIAAGLLDVVWLWESDRGSREMEDWAGWLGLCRRRGVRVYVHTHDRLYDPKIARDRRALLEDGVDAEYSSEKMSLNIRRAVLANAQAGKPHGETPYGYERIYALDAAGQRVLVAQQPHPEHAKVVQEIFARLAQADTLTAIRTDLARRGVPTPRGGKGWLSGVIRRIAKNPAYIGERRLDGQVYKGQWPALVDDKTWSAVQSLLGDPARSGTRPGRVRWMASSVATCGRCGLGSDGRPAHQSHPPAYVCPHGHVGVKSEWLDGLLSRLVVARLSKPDVYADLAARSADDTAVVAARSEAATLRARLDEFYAEARAGRLSAGGLGALEGPLLADIAAADQRADRAVVPPVLRQLLEPGVDIQERWDSMPVAARKEVLRLLFRKIEILPAGAHRGLDQLPDRLNIEWREDVNT